MATLAMLVGARGLAELISGRRTQIVTNTGFLEFTPGLIGVPVLIWIFAIVAILGWILLNRTTFGRRTVAIGGNAEASRLAGIKVKRHPSGLRALRLHRRHRRHHDARPHDGRHVDPRHAVRVGCHRGGRRRWHAPHRWPRNDRRHRARCADLRDPDERVHAEQPDTSVQAIAKGLIIVVAVLLQQRFAKPVGRE